MPPVDLTNLLGAGPIPASRRRLSMGIPAELLRRRPDVRRRNAGGRAGRADRHRPGRSVSGVLHQRHAGLSAQNSPTCSAHGLQRQRRPVVPMERVELRPNRQQRPLPRCKIPGIGGHLSEHGAPGQQEVEDGLVTFLRSQRRTKLLDESVTAASRDRRARSVVLQYRTGSGRFQPLRGDSAEPGHAARSIGAGPRPDRPGVDCRVPGDGRRLGDPTGQ